jgi:hypothetical protein
MTEEKTPLRDVGAREYLGTIFEPSDRLAVLVRNHLSGEIQQRITSAGRVEEPSFQDWLQFKNREGFDVYIGMNPLKPASRTRTKDDVLSIKHLYLDLDYQGTKSLATIQQSNLVPPPNYVLSTSPDKFQVIWRVEEITQQQAESLLRAMARKFGGDPAATDTTRVLRIPGFANKKYEEAFVVRAEHHSDRVHHFPDFKVRIDQFDASYQPLRRNSASSGANRTRALSQSEHDWAFAKRALARGADPEEVIQKIRDFRAGDKSDPRYYAAHTVAKAEADLKRPTGSGGAETDAADTDTTHVRQRRTHYEHEK